eukprot:g825.t1
MVINGIALLILYGMYEGTAVYFEASLLFAMVGFISTRPRPMDLLIEGLIALLIVGAGFFGIVGSFGLAKLPDLMTRLHGPTKATTLGIGGVLIASMLFFLASCIAG